MFVSFFSFHLIIGGPILDGIKPYSFLWISLDGIITIFFSVYYDLLDGRTSLFFSIFIDFGRHKIYFPFLT